MADDSADSPDVPAGPIRDLRKSAHDDFGVRVDRDMSGSSMFLARGSNQHFSKISFSLRGTPRTSDPDAAVPLEQDAVAPLPAPGLDDAPSPSRERPGVFARLKGLFSG